MKIDKPARTAGVLLHPTSLPGPGGIGDLGAEARGFVDWLASSGAQWWQVLPLGPTGGGDSPYASPASLAGNPWMIDLQDLVNAGLLSEAEAADPGLPADRVDFGRVIGFKRDRLHLAADRLLAQKTHALYAELVAFRQRSPWVLDAALFQVLREQRDYRPWWTWEAELRERHPRELQRVREEFRSDVDRYIVLQAWFDRQWSALRSYAAAKKIRILGDVPIYVDADSADTWTHRFLFQLETDGRPSAVAGVPPDYFSESGQLWGNPLYDWGAMRKDGYRWWAARLERLLQMADLVRIDHFRGFAAYWAVPWGAEDARGGQWQPGPGLELFRALERHFGVEPGGLPLVAEDLGVVDDAVVALRDGAGLPGMLVLQFAWGGDAANPFLPHNHVQRAAVYTGTHDNDTTLGWWRSSPEARNHLAEYLGHTPSEEEAPWLLTRLALQSVAELAVIPRQDLLSLGSEARLNTPGLPEHNWTWRLPPGQLTAELAERLHRQLQLSHRLA
jgi:4-alpha-glucanotransferase